MLRWFESNPAQLKKKLIVKGYNPIMFRIVKYNSKPNMKQPTNKKTRNFGTLNKFLSGAIITRIDPVTLLMKKLGYREMLVQKSLIEYD
jgi:hypothetical protein